MRRINFTGLLLLGLAAACNPATEKNTTDKVVENTVVSEEVKEVPNERLIVPGKQAGKIYLGQDMQEVFTLLGRPDEGDAAMGSALGIWTKDSVAIFSSYKDSTMVAKTVKQISVSSAAFNTADHIHAGMPLAQFKAALPAIKEGAAYVNEKTRDTLRVYDDMAGGIGFDVVDGKCVSVIIHPKDKPVNSTYLSTYPGWKIIQ